MSPNEPGQQASAPPEAQYSDNEVIRRRPVMYIGSTDTRGLHHLIYELLSNSVDAITAASLPHTILVALLKDGGCRVVDDGPGFPVDPTTEEGKRVFEHICTRYYSPGRGLFGIGLKAVTALSRRMVAEVQNHGKAWRQVFQRGHPVTPVVAVRDSTFTGTSITFWPDPEIFPLGANCQFSWDVLSNRLRDLAFLLPSATFCLIDDRNSVRKHHIFQFPDGLRDYLRYLNREAEAVHPTLFHFVDTEGESRVEIALQWTQSTESRIRTFCNTDCTTQGGTHLNGFREGLTNTLMQLLGEHRCRPKRRSQKASERFRRGLTAIVAVTLRDPQFDSQEKRRLNSLEIEPFVQRSFAHHFAAFLRQHPADADAIAAKVQANLSAP